MYMFNFNNILNTFNSIVLFVISSRYISDNRENIKHYLNNVLTKTLWRLEKCNLIIKCNIDKLKKKFNNNNIDYEFYNDELEYIKDDKIVLKINNKKYNNIKNFLNYNIEYDFVVHTIYKTDDNIYIQILKNIDEINYDYKISKLKFIYIDFCMNSDEENKIVIDKNYIFNIIGNVVFDRSFMKWFLSKYHNISLNDERYTINTIDSNIVSDKYINNNKLNESLLIKENSFVKNVNN